MFEIVQGEEDPLAQWSLCHMGRVDVAVLDQSGGRRRFFASDGKERSLPEVVRHGISERPSVDQV